MRVQSLLRLARPADDAARFVFKCTAEGPFMVDRTWFAITIAGLFLLIGGIEFGTAAAQAKQPVPKVSPQFPSSIAPTRTVFVQVGTLGWGETIDRPIPFNPRPTKGVMSVSGTWSQAVMGVEGGLGHVSLKVTVKSPSGTIVARGCGYSLDSNLRPALVLHAIGMTVSPEAPVQWTVSVERCGHSEPLTAISNVRIRIDY